MVSATLDALVRRLACLERGMRRAERALFEPLQPVRHAQLTIHRPRRPEVLLYLRELTRPPVEPSEPGMAVRHERAHLQLRRQCQR